MDERDRKLLNSYFFANGVIAVNIAIVVVLVMLTITAYTFWNMT
jgi:flagellar basal body-associated protein FliL